MPIFANIPPKRGRRPKGNVFPPAEGGAIGFYGTSYSSPFTHSAKPPLGTYLSIGTQKVIPAMQSPVAGVVVPMKHYRKIHPSEAAAFVAPSAKAIPIVRRAGGVSKDHSTPFNPNTYNAKLRKATTPPRVRPKPPLQVAAKSNVPSFLHSGRTISSHPHQDVVTPGHSRFVVPVRHPLVHTAAPMSHAAVAKVNRHLPKRTPPRLAR